jgi:hypothetical protein
MKRRRAFLLFDDEFARLLFGAPAAPIAAVPRGFGTVVG